MTTFTELADRLTTFFSWLKDYEGDDDPADFCDEGIAIAAELRSLEAQPQSVNAELLEALSYAVCSSCDCSIASGLRSCAMCQPIRDFISGPESVEKVPAPEVSLADCKNPECPVGCPDSHCMDLVDYESDPAQPDVVSGLLKAAKEKLEDCRRIGDCSDPSIAEDEFCSDACGNLARAIKDYEAQSKAEPKA